MLDSRQDTFRMGHTGPFSMGRSESTGGGEVPIRE